MARYGKTIKTVETLINRAMKRGKAHIKRYGRKVYEITYNEEENTLSLYHYGTLTLYYNLKTGEILGWDGFSASDRDSLNTALDYVKHTDNEYFRIKDYELDLIQEEENIRQIQKEMIELRKEHIKKEAPWILR